MLHQGNASLKKRQLKKKEEVKGTNSVAICILDQPPIANGKPANGFTTANAFCIGLNAANQPIKIFKDKLEDLVAEYTDAEIMWINITVKDVAKEAPDIAKSLHFNPSLLNGLLTDKASAYEDMDVELGLKVPGIKINQMDVKVYPLIILIKKGVILTIHPEEITRLQKFARYAETFMKKIPQDSKWNDKLSLVLARLLAENNERNFDGLRGIEESADIISQDLLNPNVPREKLGMEIYKMKHALIVYLNALWNILDVIQSLRYGDADAITDEPAILSRLESLVTDVTGQISLSEHMSEVLASGLEVMQSIYNNQLQILNNRMAFVVAWLTILGTALLVPNTLATIMSSGAFSLGPSDRWWYISFMVGSTVIATVVTYFAIKKWIPKRTD
jgi:magnesium transporter